MNSPDLWFRYSSAPPTLSAMLSTPCFNASAASLSTLPGTERYASRSPLLRWYNSCSSLPSYSSSSCFFCALSASSCCSFKLICSSYCPLPFSRCSLSMSACRSSISHSTFGSADSPASLAAYSLYFGSKMPSVSRFCASRSVLYAFSSSSPQVSTCCATFSYSSLIALYSSSLALFASASCSCWYSSFCLATSASYSSPYRIRPFLSIMLPPSVCACWLCSASAYSAASLRAWSQSPLTGCSHSSRSLPPFSDLSASSGLIPDFSSPSTYSSSSSGLSFRPSFVMGVICSMLLSVSYCVENTVAVPSPVAFFQPAASSSLSGTIGLSFRFTLPRCSPTSTEAAPPSGSIRVPVMAKYSSRSAWPTSCCSPLNVIMFTRSYTSSMRFLPSLSSLS